MDSAKNAFEYRPAATTRSTGEGINFKGPMSTNSAASRAFKKSKMLKHINEIGEQHKPPIPSPSALSGGVHGFDQATLLLTDLDFFEQELIQHQNSIAETLADKRLAQGLMNEDPMEELTEVYSEVQVIETDFKKTLGICQHLLTHSRELFTKNQDFGGQLEQLK